MLALGSQHLGQQELLLFGRKRLGCRIIILVDLGFVGWGKR
jgi:hypothetical protein